MSDFMSELLARLEPESLGSPDRTYVASIAISLKRIADALDREAEGGAAETPPIVDDDSFVETPRTRRAKNVSPGPAVRSSTRPSATTCSFARIAPVLSRCAGAPLFSGAQRSPFGPVPCENSPWTLSAILGAAISAALRGTAVSPASSLPIANIAEAASSRFMGALWGLG